MPAQGAQDVCAVNTHHKPQLARGFGSGRNGVDRIVRIACFEGQHFERTPAKNTLGGTEARLPPIGLNLRAIGTTINFAVSQYATHGIGQ